MKSEVISARFESEIIHEIDQFIKSGDFGSRGEFVQFAVRKMLLNYPGRIPPR